MATPNMGLVLPTVGVTAGPTYATENNDAFTTIDSHDHTSGKGVPVPSAGLNINADLSFNDYNATALRSVRFTSQDSTIGGATDLGCLYESGVDLYYNDGNGNQIQVTAGGKVNATSSGITSGTATASFSGSVLVVNSNTNTPANIKAGSLLIGNNVTSSNYATLSAPNPLAANYQLFLPTIPASTSFVTLDSSGNLSGSVSTTAGITGGNIAASTITGTQITSNINLPGNTVQENGKNVVVSNTNAASSLAIVRGSIRYFSGGTSDNVTGEGWSSSRTGTGAYTITFSSAFADTPTVVVGLMGSANSTGAGLVLGSESTTGFQVNTSFVNGSAVDVGFSFVAIGQRA